MLRDVGVKLDGFEDKLRALPTFKYILEDHAGRNPTVLDPTDLLHFKGLEKFPAPGKAILP